MKRKSWYSLLAAALLIAAAAAIIVWIQFFGSAVPRDRELYIGRNADYRSLSDSLMPSLRHRAAFGVYARRLDLENTFKQGYYRLEKGMSVIDVARMLKLGRQTPVMVRINNVRTSGDLAHKLSQQIEADSASIIAVLNDIKLASEMGFGGGNIFPLFIPNTYELYWTVSPEELVERMHTEYDRFWTANREASRRKTGLSRGEVITLASIVGEETSKQDEMPRIAGVYMNRLHNGMPLQADPTVKYAVGDFTLRRILYSHLKYDSPYNTYINKGLPPGPISMPSIAAIDAVLGYEKHGYMFFCARPTFDGYHNFARTLTEHNANARAYSAELNRRNIK